MRIDVVSIFPDYLSPLNLSLIGKARREGLLDVRVHDLRDHTHDRHRTVDDAPYGGGAGMVMRPEPWAEALDALLASGTDGEVPHLLVPGPGGVPFTQAMARELAGASWLAFACGRYEGIDERVYEHAADRMPVTVVSLGDYVLGGGEVAVLAMVEAVARLVPGVVGNAESLVEESHEDGLLEYPVYTRPATWDDGGTPREVPPVLLSGDHAAIASWRHTQRLTRTAARRPDLLHVSATLAVGSDGSDGSAGFAGSGEGLADAELRAATGADVGELLTLTHACWLKEGILNETFQIPAIHETVESMRASLGEWDTYVLRSGGRLVGSVRAKVSGASWYVGRLMVAPDLRGAGLGRWLLARIEELAPDGPTELRLTTGAKSVGNQRMYKQAGYRIVDRNVSWGTVELVKPRI